MPKPKRAKPPNDAARELSRLAHLSMTPAERVTRAKKAAAARWGKKPKKLTP